MNKWIVTSNSCFDIVWYEVSKVYPDGKGWETINTFEYTKKGYKAAQQLVERLNEEITQSKQEA